MTSKQQWWIPLKNLVYSGKTFFDISVNTGQICMGFEADTPENDSNMEHANCMGVSDKNLVKKLLTSNRKIQLLVNNILTRSLSESC